MKLVGSPVWTGCNHHFRTQAGPRIISDAKFWLPLLALYHGARLEEFADLYGRDFGRDDGTWFIHIRESEDRRRKKRLPDGRKVEGRRLKNDNAQRWCRSPRTGPPRLPRVCCGQSARPRHGPVP